MHQVADGFAARVLWYHRLVAKVQTRLCAVVKHLTDTFGSKRRMGPDDAELDEAKRLNIPQAVLASEHDAIIEANGAHCVLCWTGCGRGTRQLHRWLLTPCTPIFESDEAQASSRDFVRIPRRMQVQFKGKLLHESHELRMYRGMVFCSLCGFYASNHAKKLLDPCMVAGGAERTAQGKSCLRRLAKGLTPHPTVHRWPDMDTSRAVEF